MITRIVKMNFSAGKEKDFLEIFHSAKEKISGCKGCISVELLRDVKDGHVFFTISQWESEMDLEAYRHSELFRSTWGKTKILFSGKAEAWTVRGQ